MEQLYECGEKVLYTMVDDGRKYFVGIVLKYNQKTDMYAILHCNGFIDKNIKTAWISPIFEVTNARRDISEYWDSQINELKAKIRTVTKEEKDAEKTEKYEELKKRIKTIAERMCQSEDDTEFENRLKEICQLKKAIFSIELECGHHIRLDNGKIKHEIKQLNEYKQHELSLITDEKIESVLNF